MRACPATDWMDVEAGKRLVRWGVGYGFSPAGVLDPPRIATDPTDRLGVNEGRMMARVDLFHHDSSLTVAAAANRPARGASADRAPGGLEVALIASAAPGAGPSWGGTVTHVVGRQLEWHAEVIAHDAKDRRAMSAVAGVQYTFQAGVNVVLDYHRDGLGLDGRQESLFVRAAGSGAETRLAPEIILIAGLNDGSRTVVPGDRLDAGPAPADSRARDAPVRRAPLHRAPGAVVDGVDARRDRALLTSEWPHFPRPTRSDSRSSCHRGGTSAPCC